VFYCILNVVYFGYQRLYVDQLCWGTVLYCYVGVQYSIPTDAILTATMFCRDTVAVGVATAEQLTTSAVASQISSSPTI